MELSIHLKAIKNKLDIPIAMMGYAAGRKLVLIKTENYNLD